MSDRDVTPTTQQRKQLADTRLPPEDTAVWAAQHRGRWDFHVDMARLTANHQDDHWASARHRRMLVCALVFRGISLLVRTCDGPGVPHSRVAADHWARIWPIEHDLQWRPAWPVGDDDVHRAVVGTVEQLRLPEARIVHAAPGWQRIRRN